MLLAEEVLLLLTDDRTGKFAVDGSHLDLALAGALLIELAEHQRVRVTQKGEAADGRAVRAGRVRVSDATPMDDPVLDEALRRVIDQDGKKPDAVLNALKKDLRPVLLDRLARAGILRQEEGTVLWLFPTTSWPAVDSRHEAQLRQGLEAVLLHGTAPDRRLAGIIGLLSAVDAAHKVIDARARDVDTRAVKRRAKELREQAWAADAVGKAIEAIQSAVVATMVTTMAATTTTTSS